MWAGLPPLTLSALGTRHALGLHAGMSSESSRLARRAGSDGVVLAYGSAYVIACTRWDMEGRRGPCPVSWRRSRGTWRPDPLHSTPNPPQSPGNSWTDPRPQVSVPDTRDPDHPPAFTEALQHVGAGARSQDFKTNGVPLFPTCGSCRCACECRDVCV